MRRRTAGGVLVRTRRSNTHTRRLDRRYYDVAKNVEPLRAKVRAMEKEQAKTTKLLSDLNAQLSTLEKELGELDTNFKAKNEELTGLQTQAALMEKRLAAASKLITGLTGERTRWTADIEDLNNNKVQLVGDCLLAASFLSYAGAFTNDFRSAMIYGSFADKVAELGVPARTRAGTNAFKDAFFVCVVFPNISAKRILEAGVPPSGRFARRSRPRLTSKASCRRMRSSRTGTPKGCLPTSTPCRTASSRRPRRGFRCASTRSSRP